VERKSQGADRENNEGVRERVEGVYGVEEEQPGLILKFYEVGCSVGASQRKEIYT